MDRGQRPSGEDARVSRKSPEPEPVPRLFPCSSPARADSGAETDSGWGSGSGRVKRVFVGLILRRGRPVRVRSYQNVPGKRVEMPLVKSVTTTSVNSTDIGGL